MIRSILGLLHRRTPAGFPNGSIIYCRLKPQAALWQSLWETDRIVREVTEVMDQSFTVTNGAVWSSGTWAMIWVTVWSALLPLPGVRSGVWVFVCWDFSSSSPIFSLYLLLPSVYSSIHLKMHLGLSLGWWLYYVISWFCESEKTFHVFMQLIKVLNESDKKSGCAKYKE